jgi:hypothetical protein
MVVRFGKRTYQGIAKDGWNALARYYLNNFADGTKQVHYYSYNYLFSCFLATFVVFVINS